MTMAPAQAVKVFEVGPRDGLQNERQQLSVATRVALIGALAATSSALMRRQPGPRPAGRHLCCSPGRATGIRGKPCRRMNSQIRLCLVKFEMSPHFIWLTAAQARSDPSGRAIGNINLGAYWVALVSLAHVLTQKLM